MKIISLIVFILFSNIIDGQPPQAINYQGAARDSVGHPLINHNIGIRLSILDSSITGQAVYVETHNVTTNASGLFNLGIGIGTEMSGTFSSIPWGKGDKWMQIEMDATGGSNYQLIGTTQFLSVPYALNAKNGNRQGIKIGDLQYWDGTTWQLVSAGLPGQYLQMGSANIPNWTGPQFPSLATSAISSDFIINGIILNDGGAQIISKGFCFDTLSNPTVESNTITNDPIDIFTVKLWGLRPNKTYHIKSFATNIAGTGYGNEVVFTTPLEPFLGAFFQGGIVFYIDGSGQHGLITTNYDLVNSIWGCTSTSILGAHGTSIGTGLSNTNAIVNNCNMSGIAAQICKSLSVTDNGNLYDDWYLPSIDELKTLRDFHFSMRIGGHNFIAPSGDVYWSSTEFDYLYSWRLYMGIQSDPATIYSKDYPHRVRAIRAF